MPSRRQRKLEAVVAHLQLRYGPRSVFKVPAGDQASAATPVPSISTTFAELDAALGIGGIPRGRLTEIVGPATSGKVTLAAKILAAAQRESDVLVAWLDLSRTCDPDYMHRCGIDIERLLVVRPEGAADALAIVLHLVESNTLAALAFDGMADLRDLALRGAGGLEPLLDGTLERLAAVAANGQTAVVFLSEPHAQYRTLAHLAALRLEIHRERWLTRGNDVRGYEGQVKITKNKLGHPGATAPLRITFNGTVQSDGML